MARTVSGLVEVRAVSREYEGRYQKTAPCYVYEVWDTRGRLAYVGIADNFERRWAQHVRSSWWLGEVEIDHVYIIGYATRREARWSEACAINEQSPIYNTNPESGSYAQYRRWEDAPWVEGDRTLRPVAKRKFRPVRQLLGAH
jgi:excinuclease UvrABC nuclease subunit